jgi:hypothetical protein
LYLQALGETGIVGFVLLLAGLVAMLVALVRRLGGPQRPFVAALVACAAGWLIPAGLDWDWQVAAVTLWLFSVGGIAVARAAEEAPARRPIGLVARAAIGVVLIATAGVPALVAISQSEVDSALDAYASSDCAAAADAARSARAALPPRAEPRMTLGWCASRRGHARQAIADLRSAVDRADGDWETHYGLAIVLAADGQDPRAEVAAAARLNPREPTIQQAASAFAATRAWKRPALRASLFVNGLPYPPLGG